MVKAKKGLIVSSMVLALVLTDQLVKWIIRSTMQLDTSIGIIRDFLSISHIHNYGAGFGILQGQRWIFIWLAVALIGFMIYYFDQIKESDRFMQVIASLVLAGTIGNMIDRLFFGYVTDFISFSFWPAFNIADSCLSEGAVCFGIWALKNR